MKKFTVLGYRVNVCQDIEEWGKVFYDLPEDAKIDNKPELESECMGFAQPEDKEMWLFIPHYYKHNDLSETIAHELGHLMTFKTDDYPEEEREEKKAEHYENFYKLVVRIRLKAFRIVTD
jgi:hypothetical protein